jgi:phospholipid/cholesterol/gamma-HCH transport system ATP-binding protein
MSSHITADKLTIGWGDFILMREVSFAITRGSCFAILGGSGCGKSTLLRHQVGLERAKAGSIHIDGWGAPRLPDGPPPFGVMYQSGALFGSLDLMDNCLVPLRTWTDLSEEAARALVMAKLDLVGLGPFAAHLPGEISGGMKKRAGIARAMVLEPDLLFLDEPSAGLDPISAVELDDLVRTLIDELGITVVIVTHELPSIYRIVDDCILLEKNCKRGHRPW